MDLGTEAQSLILFTGILIASYLLAVLRSGVELDEFYSPLFVTFPVWVLSLLANKIPIHPKLPITSDLYLNACCSSN